MIAAKQTAYFVTRALPSCILLVIINTLLIFLLPPSHTTMDAYHLSSLEYRIISFAIALPSYLVWIAAFIGYSKLLDYANAIKNTSEAKNFHRLAIGGVWLAWSLPLSKIFSTLLTSLENVWPGFHTAAVILSNYFSLILPLIAFTLIGAAARGLLNSSKLKLPSIVTKTLIIVFAVAGLSYCYLIFGHLDMSSLSNNNNGYYLPVWLMLLTVIIPYLYMWFIGLLAACDLTIVGMKIKGHLYKRALSYLIVGLVVVLIGSIAIQYLYSMQPRSGHLILDIRLALILISRTVQGVGFALIAFGASKLKKIEEV